jgi:hypothetical protein
MCDTCDVTDEQYDHARLVAHNCCMATLYEDQGVAPGLYDYRRPGAEVIRIANDHIRRYHAAHPGEGLTQEELIAEFAKRGA